MNSTATKIFLDTNFITYIFDSRDVEKQKKARSIFSGLVASQNCCISTQVLQELFNVLTKKLHYSKEDAQRIILNLKNIPVREIKIKDVELAIEISIASQFTIYDSLILAAAKALGCEVVYSEDLNHGQVVEGVRIENPFI